MLPPCNPVVSTPTVCCGRPRMFVHCVDQYLGERMMAENRLWRLVYAVELQVHYF
jgi:hypothetical protein